MCAALFAIAMVVNIGMWLERFMIVVVSLHRDFMPSAWGMYYPTRWDLFTFFGTIGLFLFVAVSVHPLSAADFHLRDAGIGAASEAAGSRSREGNLRRAEMQRRAGFTD